MPFRGGAAVLVVLPCFFAETLRVPAGSFLKCSYVPPLTKILSYSYFKIVSLSIKKGPDLGPLDELLHSYWQTGEYKRVRVTGLGHSLLANFSQHPGGVAVALHASMSI